jgi:type II secretory pathway pseudopilin PulG
MSAQRKIRSEDGFSYIDVMIALVILTVGILALLAAISGSILQSRGQDQQLRARQILNSTMESIMSVKETDEQWLGWISVGNIGTNPDINGNFHGVFIVGPHEVHENAGFDQVIGTPDDDGPVVPGFEREITITDICDPDRPSQNCSPAGDNPVKMREVEVVIRYFVGRIRQEEKVQTILTDYSADE